MPSIAFVSRRAVGAYWTHGLNFTGTPRPGYRSRVIYPFRPRAPGTCRISPVRFTAGRTRYIASDEPDFDGVIGGVTMGTSARCQGFHGRPFGDDAPRTTSPSFTPWWVECPTQCICSSRRLVRFRTGPGARTTDAPASVSGLKWSDVPGGSSLRRGRLERNVQPEGDWCEPTGEDTSRPSLPPRTRSTGSLL